jgi:hypothetical protein
VVCREVALRRDPGALGQGVAAADPFDDRLEALDTQAKAPGEADLLVEFMLVADAGTSSSAWWACCSRLRISCSRVAMVWYMDVGAPEGFSQVF